MFLLILHSCGQHSFEIFLFAAILAGLLAMHLVLRAHRLPFVTWFIESFEREGVRAPGFGSAWYAMGVLFATVSIQGIAPLSAVICILAFGDSLSTIIGRRGTHPLPYNRKKTIEGSIAFFLGSLSACYFLGPLAVPLALACALAESLPLPFDDNIVVPAAAILFFMAVGTP
jgi:dolichol kinase